MTGPRSIEAQFVKGDRVKLSPEGLRLQFHGRGYRHGTVLGFGIYVRVRWDGNKSGSLYHPDFIAKIKEGAQT